MFVASQEHVHDNDDVLQRQPKAGYFSSTDTAYEYLRNWAMTT